MTNYQDFSSSPYVYFGPDDCEPQDWNLSYPSQEQQTDLSGAWCPATEALGPSTHYTIDGLGLGLGLSGLSAPQELQQYSSEPFQFVGADPNPLPTPFFHTCTPDITFDASPIDHTYSSAVDHLTSTPNSSKLAISIPAAHYPSSLQQSTWHNPLESAEVPSPLSAATTTGSPCRVEPSTPGDGNSSAPENIFQECRGQDGRLRCPYPRCTSDATFARTCDLRKHYKRHTKRFFCRVEGCSQAGQAGFSSRKDRARHESKHNPEVECEWPGCERLFSRVDNMKDHVRRIHARKME